LYRCLNLEIGCVKALHSVDLPKIANDYRDVHDVQHLIGYPPGQMNNASVL
jgi:hypothetical protein